MNEMEIRFAVQKDVEGILLAHRSAVRQTAAKDYPPEVIEEWSAPVTPERVERYIANSLPKETTIVAVIDNKIAGFGAIVESLSELRAVYVAAEFAKSGIGTKLLEELEKIAKERGCLELKMHSSLTACGFYIRHGYNEVEKAYFTLRSGRKMESVKMRKTLG